MALFKWLYCLLLRVASAFEAREVVMPQRASSHYGQAGLRTRDLRGHRLCFFAECRHGLRGYWESEVDGKGFVGHQEASGSNC